MMKRILAGVFACLLLCSNVIGAEDSNITITKKNFRGNVYKEIVWFSAYNVGDDTGTSYDYNEAQGAGDSDGLVDALHYTLKKTIQIDVITLGSTSIDVRVEGRAGSSAEWGEIVTITFTAVTGANNSHIVNICEFIEEVRVGVKANTAGTDSITITGILLGDKR
jgi:hypothetical protein